MKYTTCTCIITGYVGKILDRLFIKIFIILIDNIISCIILLMVKKNKLTGGFDNRWIK